MNLTDILIILGISGFMVLGFRDGLFKKIFGVLGVWGGLIMSIKFMNPFSENLAAWFELSTEISLIVAIFIVVLFTIIIVNVLYRWFGASASENLQVRSRIAGAFLGGGQGLLAISLMLVMLSLYETPSDEEKSGSVLYKSMFKIAPFVYDYSTQWMPSSGRFVDILRKKNEDFKVPR